MLTLDELKDALSSEMAVPDKALLILASLNKPSQVAEIKKLGRAAGLREIEKWNISAVLSRTRGLAINTSAGWELSNKGRERVGTLNGGSSSRVKMPAIANEVAVPELTSTKTNKIFLVHGRDVGSMHEVARFLERIGLDVTILHERPNKGRSLISKFEEESSDISYAVVLMTPDDHGGLKGDALSDRARQNVVFELGFFIGRLGAENVCALVKPGIERPSDFEAVVYVELDGGRWKTELARELREAGIPFDPSKVF